VRADGKVAYLAGLEGAGDGAAGANAGAGVFAWQQLGPSDGFVRAVDTATGKELWTGRDSSELLQPGSTTTVLMMVPVGRDVVTVGQAYVAAQGATWRSAWEVGRVLRFHGD
jgi:hypothetical protein